MFFSPQKGWGEGGATEKIERRGREGDGSKQYKQCVVILRETKVLPEGHWGNEGKPFITEGKENFLTFFFLSFFAC